MSRDIIYDKGYNIQDSKTFDPNNPTATIGKPIPNWKNNIITYLAGPISFTIMEHKTENKLIYLIGDPQGFSNYLHCGDYFIDDKTIYITKFLRRIFENNHDNNNKEYTLDVFTELGTFFRNGIQNFGDTGSAIVSNMYNEFTNCFKDPTQCSKEYGNFRLHHTDYALDFDQNDPQFRVSKYHELGYILSFARKYSKKSYVEQCSHVPFQIFYDNIYRIYNRLFVSKFTKDGEQSIATTMTHTSTHEFVFTEVLPRGLRQPIDIKYVYRSFCRWFMLLKKVGLLEPEIIFDAMLNYSPHDNGNKKILKNYNSIIPSDLKNIIRDYFVERITYIFDNPFAGMLRSFNDIYKSIEQKIENDDKKFIQDQIDNKSAYLIQPNTSLDHQYGTYMAAYTNDNKIEAETLGILIVSKLTDYIMDLYLILRLYRVYIKRYRDNESHSRYVNKAIIITGQTHIDLYKDFLENILNFETIFTGKQTIDLTSSRNSTRCVDVSKNETKLGKPLKIKKLIRMQSQSGGDLQSLYKYYKTSYKNLKIYMSI
jgi:hypothetical protein